MSERTPLLPAGPAPATEHMRSIQNTPTAKGGKDREAFFDNVKGLTVLVVIFSHTCMTYVSIFDIAIMRACWVMGALVAMPAFSFVSGHLSSADLTPKRMVGIAKMLLVFMTYQLLYFLAGQIYVVLPKAGYIHGGMGAHKEAGLPLPIWGQENVSWFLLCLVVWRVVLPLVVRLHRPILCSVVVCFLSIFLDEGKNFMPIFGFFPFFILGHTYSRADLWAMRSRNTGLGCFVVPFLLLIVASFAASKQMRSMMSGKHHHGDMPNPKEMFGPALFFEVPSMIVGGGFSCLCECPSFSLSGARLQRPVSQCFTTVADDQEDSSKPGNHRRQLGGVGIGCYDVGAVFRLLFYAMAYVAIKGWLSVIPRRPVKLLTNAGAFSLCECFALSLGCSLARCFLPCMTQAGSRIADGYLLHPFFIWYLPWIQEGVHIAATFVGGQSVGSEVSNAGGVLVVLLFVVLLWLVLSSAAGRFACMLCTEPAIDCLFIDPEAPTPALNTTAGGGSEKRACWSWCTCLQCLCCAADDGEESKPRRPLAITLPDEARPGHSLTVQTPWGERVQVIVPEGSFGGGVAHFMV